MLDRITICCSFVYKNNGRRRHFCVWKEHSHFCLVTRMLVSALNSWQLVNMLTVSSLWFDALFEDFAAHSNKYFSLCQIFTHYLLSVEGHSKLVRYVVFHIDLEVKTLFKRLNFTWN